MTIEKDFKPGDEITLVILTEEDLKRGIPQQTKGEDYGEDVKADR